MRWIMILTIFMWAILTIGMADSYVMDRVNLSNAVGYEKEWDWQLLFFSITRLPLLIAGLCLVLWFEAKLIRS